MKLLFSICLLFLAFSLQAQYVVKGVVVDENGHGVPGARVAVENTTYGVPTNAKGNFFLEVENKGPIVISFSMLGFADRVDTIDVDKTINEVEITLFEEATSLNMVEIYADKRDIAKEVMKAVIDNKKNMQRQYETYQCNTYIKTTLEKENRIPFLKGDEEPEGKQKMNFIESYSITRFKANSTFKEQVLAHHDYSEKSSSEVVVSADFSDPNSILPSQTIEYNPYIFFEKVQDGEFDLYQNLIELPKVSSKPLVSPVAINAFVNYKFFLKSVFIEDGQKIYDIILEPRFNEAPLFSGDLFIIDSLWVIKSMDLKINPAAMEYFKDFRIIQDFENVDGNWVPVRREFIYTLNDGPDLVMANTRSNHTDYQFDLEFDKNEFKNIIMTYDDDAFDKDSAYWAQTRPIQLKPEELKFIAQQDSVMKELQSDEYIDSVNAEYNKITVWDFLLNGVGFRSREKKQEVYFNSLINSVHFMRLGGYRQSLGGYYSKEFNNAQKIKIDGNIDYGFRLNNLKGFLSAEYTFLPKKFGSLKIGGGNVYDFVTFNESIVNFIGPGNQVEKTYVEVSQRLELFNGLYGRATFDYSKRESIADTPLAPWQQWLSDTLDWLPPIDYTTYTVSILELEFLYRFKQKYIIKKGKKIVVGTQFPELRLTYKAGIPNLFGSDVNFNFIEVGASDEVTLGTFGKMKWDVEAGTFLGDQNNINSIQFIERKFFRGSDLFFFSNPLQTMQLLDSTFNTARPYMQAYVIHHFNGAIMSKIPLINKLKIELVGGGGIMLIKEINYRHLEFYAGIERKFKIRKQLFKAAVFYVVRENNQASVNLNFKVGLDFFNSWTNKWSW
ncbi:MAG: DUF5686 family protein [Crocinitomicaceae bacterium]